MSFVGQKESLIEVTRLMSNKEKFSYINVPKAAVVALNKVGDNSFPSKFAKNVVTSLKMNDSRLLKAVSYSLKDDVAANRHHKIGLNKSNRYYYSNVFEHSFFNDRETYSSFIDFYIRYGKTAVVTFNDPKIISKMFGHNVRIMNVPYHNYYEKVDDVYAQLAELDGELDYCILDCGVMGLGLLPKVWNNLNVSMIDFGKTITISKNSRNGSDEKSL